MPAPRPLDPNLIEYCTTDHQRRVVQALIENGGHNARAAKQLGINQPHSISRIRSDVEARAARAGYTPSMDLTKYVPSGYSVKGQSLLLGPDGEIKQQWLKTDKSVEEKKEEFKKYINGLCADIVPAKPTKKLSGKRDEELMSAIFIGDAHIGMYAYGRETKHSDFDSEIASAGLRAAIDDLVARSPNAETGLLVDVGDFMHSNTGNNRTFSGTELDVDTRWGRVLRIAGMVMRYAISKMLEKFPQVIVVIAKGNHNPNAAEAVQEIVSAYFHNEPRVKVLETVGVHHYIEWGKWLIGVNHGDKIKPDKLVNVMARDMAQAWGRTTHRMWACGHFHHVQVIELDGCTVHRFGALPPPDAWHASMGYGGDGQMKMITFKKSGGTHSTTIYDVPRPELDPDWMEK